MTQFERPSFSVPLGGPAYAEGWERTFGPGEEPRHYLITYLRPVGHLLSLDIFTDSKNALQALAGKEAMFRGLPGVEVCLLSADSLEALMSTHSRYFLGA